MCTWNLQHRTQKPMQSRVSSVRHSQKAIQGLWGFRIRHPKTLGGLETLGGSCLKSGPGMADFGGCASALLYPDLPVFCPVHNISPAQASV
jgi:hypothetical protein